MPLELEGTARRLPIYLVVDRSGSMAGTPIQAVQAGIAEVARVARANPEALETAWLSVIAFNGKAERLVPLTEVGAFRAPTLVASGGTDYGAAIEELGNALSQEVRAKTSQEGGADYSPQIFFFTDGQSEAGWEESLAGLLRKFRHMKPNLLAIGCGPEIDADTLKRLSPDYRLAPDLNQATIGAMFRIVSQSIAMAVRVASQPLPALPPGVGAGGVAE